MSIFDLFNPKRIQEATSSSGEDVASLPRIAEQVNPTMMATSAPTQEDWYWGRLATGGEEDYYWRRLSDNFYQKDLIPSTYLKVHNACYEAYNANPLAFAIIELTTSFVLGKGITIAANNSKVHKVLMEYNYPPEPGSVIIHNEAETWTAIQPQINANDAYQDGRAIKLMVAVGATLPEHYLSDGTSSTRATAAEMGLPTLLRFQRRQKVMRNMLTCILDRVIAEARLAGKIGPRVDASYDILFPEIDSADNKELAQGVYYLAQGLVAAKQQGWISDETAMQLLFQCVNEEVDVHEELAKIAQKHAQVKGGDLSASIGASPSHKQTQAPQPSTSPQAESPA